MDGGLTDNTPLFKDGIRRQLVMRTSAVLYPFRCVMRPTDTCIEALVVRGAMNMARFLQGRPCGRIIHWLEHNQTEKDLKRPGHSRRAFIACCFFTGISLLRITGMGSLVTWMAPFLPSFGGPLAVVLAVVVTVMQRHHLLL